MSVRMENSIKRMLFFMCVCLFRIDFCYSEDTIYICSHHKQFVNSSDNVPVAGSNYICAHRKQFIDTTAIDRFLYQSDKNAYNGIETITDADVKCFYESEFFMYSLVMALQHNDSIAFYMMNESIDKFYKSNSLVMGSFSKNLCYEFLNACENLCNNVYYKDFMYKSVFEHPYKYCQYRMNFVKNSKLKSVLYEGNGYVYKNDLLEELKKNCGNISSEDPYTFFFNESKMIFYSIYYADKYDLGVGCFYIFESIRDFLDDKGIIPSKKLANFTMYFLHKSYELNIPEAIEYVERYNRSNN